MSTITERVTLEEELLGTLHASEHLPLKPEGLVTPLFPDTFAASAFHSQIVEAMSQQVHAVHADRRAGAEWVFRHVDADKVGYSAAHLSLFRMLVYFAAAAAETREQRYEAVQRFIALTTTVGLQPSRLMVTYFGGGNIGGQQLPEDSAFAEAWLDAGIHRDRVIPVAGPANFTNIRRAGEPAGPRCEIYYDLPVFSLPLEIGTVVCEQYLLSTDGRPKAADISVCGAAFGVERLEMCTRRLAAIGETSAVHDLVEQLLDGLSQLSKRLFQPQAIRIANGLRALTVAAAYVGRIGSDRRGGRLRVITRDVLRAARDAGIALTDDLLRRLCASIDLQEASGAPYALGAVDAVVDWIARAADVSRDAFSISET